MVKIIKFIIVLITFSSLSYAEASTFTTVEGMFGCDENICEFKGIDEVDKGWMAATFSKKLPDVVNKMVEVANKKRYHWGYHTGPVAWNNFTDVSFKNSHLEEIPSILFETFSGLLKLEAVDVKLKDVNRDDFKFASSLQIQHVNIRIRNNQISTIRLLFTMPTTIC